MNRLLGLVPVLIAAGLLFLQAEAASAITIDDFTAGPVSLVGPTSSTDYTGLDPSHVIGGQRQISVGNFSNVGNTLDIGSHKLKFTSGTAYGYLRLMYGAQPLGADLSGGGHDRLRIYVSQVQGATPSLFQLTVTDSASQSKAYALGAGLAALNGKSGYVELQLTGFGIDLTDINRILLDVSRYPPGASFSIEGIATAGPPLAGDYNRNGIVDAKDFFTWKGQYGAALNGLQTSGVILSADGNGDGKVDALDYTFWRNVSDGGAGGISAIPEPSCALAALAVCLPMVGRRLIRGRRIAA